PRTPLGQRRDGGSRFADLIDGCRAALDAVAAVLLAPACAACNNLLEHPTRGVVCADCWRSIQPITPPVCERCGDPLPSCRVIAASVEQYLLCRRCRRRPRFVDRAGAIGEYDGALRSIVHALKYDGRRSL